MKGPAPNSAKLDVICVIFLLCCSTYCFVCKCVLYYFQRVTSQMLLTNISYHKQIEEKGRVLEEEGVTKNKLLGDRSRGRKLNIWAKFGITAQGVIA